MNNYEEVKKSFGIQAEKFASYHMSKSEYNDYLIKCVNAGGNEHALEVAAGTCICGRALALHVKDITCLDLTEAMLEQGEKLAEQSGIRNISFVVGNAISLPYEDETFDLVITRLSLHHFTEPEIFAFHIWNMAMRLSSQMREATLQCYHLCSFLHRKTQKNCF